MKNIGTNMRRSEIMTGITRYKSKSIGQNKNTPRDTDKVIIVYPYDALVEKHLVQSSALG